jgi:Transposase DDE domain
LNHDHIYVIDSLPVVACDHIRIKHATLYTDEQFRGYIASKKRYFYGLKIHLMVTKDGQPVEFFLTHGGFGDVDALKHYGFDLPEGAIIYADKAYNDYEIEDLLKAIDPIHLLPIRKKNSQRALPQEIVFVQHDHRKRIETAGSLIEQRLPKSIHAVTSQGFELKVALFVVASSLDCYINL